MAKRDALFMLVGELADDIEMKLRVCSQDDLLLGIESAALVVTTKCVDLETRRRMAQLLVADALAFLLAEGASPVAPQWPRWLPDDDPESQQRTRALRRWQKQKARRDLRALSTQHEIAGNTAAAAREQRTARGEEQCESD